MALDNVLKIYDEQGNPVDYDILASDVKFQDGKDLPTKLDELEQEIGEGGYAPPAGGIPATDLAPAVQTSLGKADSAYQKPSSGIPATDLADGVIPDTSNLATKTELSGKVDKVTGKGLSTNDYTDADKTAVGTIGSKANDNVVVKSISVNGGEAQTPTNGNVNINVQAGSQVDPATASPSMDGTAAVGTSTKYAREDHVHPHDTSKQDALTYDNAPTANSNNMVKSGGIYTALQNLLSNITIGQNGNWYVGQTDTNIKAQGEKGEDGTLTLQEGETPTLSIVANLHTEDDLQDNIKVLSAGAGKALNDKAYTNIADTIEGVEDVTFSNIVVGMRKAGLGLTKDTSSTNRATVDKVFARSELADVFKIICPSGYYFVIHGIEQDGTGMLSDFYESGWSQSVETEWSVANVDNRYQYFSINFKNSGNSNITAADLAALNSGFALKVVADVMTTPVIEIIGESGEAVKQIFCNDENGNEKVEIYDKDAVDELIDNIEVEGAYTNTPSAEGGVEVEVNNPISEYGMSFVRGQRHSQTNTTYGNYTFNDIDTNNSAGTSRITSSGVFETADFGSSVKIHVPAGWQMSIRQSKSLTSYDSSDDLMPQTTINGGDNGVTSTWSLNSEYGYWAFWAKKNDDTAITDNDISVLSSAFYIVGVEIHYSSDPAIEIIGANGVVKSIYNGEDVSTVQLYTKEAVDALIGGASKGIRVLQYNIGHFSLGTNYNTNITSSNYAEMLARWKKKIKDINADIIGMPEYNFTFGNNGSGNVLTESTGIFSGYQISVNPSASGYWINALASRYPMSNAGDYDLGSLSSAQKAYARYATININGTPVKIVVTHLNWSYDQARMESRTIEIKNLIKWLDNEPYVILMGDFNTDGQVVQSAAKTEADFMSGVNEFDPFLYGFTDNGVTYNGDFTLANHGLWGDLLTCDATGSRPDHLTDPVRGNNNPDTFYNRPFCCLDNIIVKGFSMSNVMVIDDGHLSDHCAVVCDLTMIEEGGTT